MSSNFWNQIFTCCRYKKQCTDGHMAARGLQKQLLLILLDWNTFESKTHHRLQWLHFLWWQATQVPWEVAASQESDHWFFGKYKTLLNKFQEEKAKYGILHYHNPWLKVNSWKAEILLAPRLYFILHHEDLEETIGFSNLCSWEISVSCALPANPSWESPWEAAAAVWKEGRGKWTGSRLVQFKVDNVHGRVSGFNHIPSWRLEAKFGSTSCAWQGQWRKFCCFCLCGLSTEGLVLSWKGEHLKMRCETLAEGRQDIIMEAFCAEDEHGQKFPARFRRASTVSRHISLWAALRNRHSQSVEKM